MTATATATGAVAMRGWEEEVYAEVGGAPKLSQDRVGHTFSGDIEGEGTARFLNAYRDEATTTYLGYERVVGRLAGLQGEGGYVSRADASEPYRLEYRFE